MHSNGKLASFHVTCVYVSLPCFLQIVAKHTEWNKTTKRNRIWVKGMPFSVKHGFFTENRALEYTIPRFSIYRIYVGRGFWSRSVCCDSIFVACWMDLNNIWWGCVFRMFVGPIEPNWMAFIVYSGVKISTTGALFVKYNTSEWRIIGCLHKNGFAC